MFSCSVIMVSTASNSSLAWNRFKKSITETKPRHILKLTFFVGCSIVVYYQVQSSVNKLLNPPINSYTTVVENNTLYYPAITVCREPPFRRAVYKKFGFNDIHTDSYILTTQWRNFKFDTYTLTNFWNEATYSRSNFFATLKFLVDDKSTSGSNVIDVTGKYTYQNGLCFTLKPPSCTEIVGQSSGYSILLQHDLYEYDPLVDDVPGWYIYFHEPREVWTENKKITRSRSESLFIPLNEKLDVKLEARSFSVLDNCIPDYNYSQVQCEEECALKGLKETFDCSAPWLKWSDMDECNNTTAVQNLVTEYLKFSNKHCCLTPCRFTEYGAYVLRSASYSSDSDKQIVTQSRLNIYFTTKTVFQTEEKYGYDINFFLADLGGTFGFFLGLSLIGMLEAAEVVVGIFYKKVTPEEEEESEKKNPFKYQIHSQLSWKSEYSNTTTRTTLERY